jgi:hypothetical protein
VAPQARRPGRGAGRIRPGVWGGGVVAAGLRGAESFDGRIAHGSVVFQDKLKAAGRGGVNGGEVSWVYTGPTSIASSCKRSMSAITAWRSSDLFQSRCIFRS